MAKLPKIRWTESDYRELQRQRKNYNAKITRLEKKGYPSDMLPERIYTRDIIKNVEYRKDLKNIQKHIETFTTKDAEKAVEYKGQFMPLYEKKRVETMVRSVQQEKAAKRRRLSEEKGNIRLAQEAELRPLNVNRPRSAKEWEKFITSLEKQTSMKNKAAQAEKYKQNYLKAIKSLGSPGEDLFDLISGMNAADVADGLYEDAVMEIGFTYDPLSAKNKARAAAQAWRKYAAS